MLGPAGGLVGDQATDRACVLDGAVRRFEFARVSGVSTHFWFGGYARE